MGELGFCQIQDILKTAKEQLLIDITSDAGLPIYLVRALHNKFYYGAFFSLKCFFQYIDINQFHMFVSPILTPFVLSAFFFKYARKYFYSLLILFIAVMVFGFFNLNLEKKIITYKLFFMFLSISGFVKLVGVILQKRR